MSASSVRWPHGLWIGGAAPLFFSCDTANDRHIDLRGRLVDTSFQKAPERFWSSGSLHQRPSHTQHPPTLIFRQKLAHKYTLMKRESQGTRRTCADENRGRAWWRRVDSGEGRTERKRVSREPMMHGTSEIVLSRHLSVTITCTKKNETFTLALVA